MLSYVIPFSTLCIYHVKKLCRSDLIYLATEKGRTIDHSVKISLVHVVRAVLLLYFMVCMPANITKREMLAYLQLIKVRVEHRSEIMLIRRACMIETAEKFRMFRHVSHYESYNLVRPGEPLPATGMIWNRSARQKSVEQAGMTVAVAKPVNDSIRTI